MNKNVLTDSNNKPVDELSEDIIVVGPGQILSEAREGLSLSLEEIANKLNFKKQLVVDIEQDIFDQNLPATFNRGYLRSYAKLVNVDADDVLSAYDLLGVAQVQRNEMQSFSNLTEKQAEHSRLMWVSYSIVALLFGLMVLWWLQAPEAVSPIINAPAVEQKSTITEEKITEQASSIEPKDLELIEEKTQSAIVTVTDDTPLVLNAKATDESATSDIIEVLPEQSAKPLDNSATTDGSVEITETSTAIFTFSGDCWVNIYDATGERIAWGVKKLGYVMTVSGKAPLTITLGKPELASIVFDEQPIDMSVFNVGNIAKFTLPLTL